MCTLPFALVLAAAALLFLRSGGGAVPQELPSFLRSALGPAASAPPSPIGKHRFGVGAVTLAPAGPAARRWSTFRDGVTRRTSFGHDTIVVGHGRVEELLTVTRRRGAHTWSWRIGAPGLVPRVGADGAVAFVTGHRLAPTSIAPVEILDAHGRRVTPAGLRWSLRRAGRGWRLELRLDDRRLPLPYVIDPSITFRASATATAGAVTSITVPVPAGVAAGDVMLAQIAVRSTATITQGSWTSVVRTTNGTVAQEIFRRKATSSEPASYTFTISASSKATGGIAAYVGVDSSTSNGIDTSAGNSGTSTSVTAPSVTTTRAGDMVAAFWAVDGATTLPAAGGTTQRWTLQSTGGGAKHTATAGDYTAASAGATGTKVATAGASAAWVADQVALYLDNTPPTAPNPTITESSADSYASGTAFYYRPAGAGSTFTVATAASDGQSGVKQVVFPTLAGGLTNTTPLTVTASPYQVTYSWPATTGSESGTKTFTVTDNAGGTATNTFSINSDSSVPTPATTFPGTGSYNAAGWAAGGCGSAGFCGTTAADGGSGLQLVEISIRRASNGLYWSGGSFSSAAQTWQAAAGTTSWSYAFPASNFPADGTYTVTVRATDNVSNVATASSSTFTWDTTAPAAPSSLAMSPASPANNNAPKVSGTAEAGSTVSLYTNASCTSAVAATGTAAAFASPGLSVAVADNSSTTFYATATDAAGNVSACSSGVTYVEDSAAPAAPSSLAVSPSSPANNNAPKVSGSAEAGSTVKLYTNSSCTSAVAATGTAAAFASPGLSVAVADNSSTTFYATATDAAGNVSACSSGVTYVEDSAAPSAPSSLAVSPSSPANNNAPKVSGSAEAGSTVKLYTNSSCTSAVAATGTAAAFASPGLSVAVADNSSTTFYATATDAAGNISACSSGVAYVEDSTAPAAPSSLAVTPASPANNNAPKVSGTAEAGSIAKLYTNASCTSSIAATGSAAAFSSPGLAVAVSDDSSTTFYATATDAAGNVSACSSGVTYVEDSTAPAAPSSLAVTPASPANNNAPKVSGTAEAGSTVKLYTNASCTSSVAGSGTATTFSSPGLGVAVADDSTTTFYATATDAAGNVSGCSSGVTYVEDSTAPAPPSSLSVSPSSPANNNAPKVSGSAEAGSTVKLYTNSSCTSSVAASGNAASFSSPGLTVAVSDDSSTTFYATATDGAGNVSACSSGVTYVEDSTAPTAPSSLAVTPASPANNNAPKVGGSAEAGSTVKLYTNSSCTSSVAASGTAAAFASPGLAVAVADDSTTTFYATATDAAGNLSACSSGVTYVEDSSAPLAPGFLSVLPASPANQNTPFVSGNAEAGSTVKLYTSSSCTSSVAASGTAASFASPGLSPTVADDSTTTFYATATDAAGNVSGCSTGVTYVEDSTPPAAPSGLGLSPASPANDNAPKVSGTAEAGSTVRLYTAASCTSAVAGSGTAAAFASPGLAVSVADDSSTTFRATATDAAGNVSACSGGVAYVEDSTAPSSTVSFPADGATYRAATWNGGCSSGLCGTASDGVGLQGVELSIRRQGGSYWNGGSFASATEVWLAASGTSSWSYAFPASSFPADGSYIAHVRARDAAGNVEAFSTTTFTYDGTAPTGSITAPAAAAWVHGSSVGVASDSADGGSGVQQALFEVSPTGAGSWSTIGADSSAPYTATWDTTGLADGSYDLRVVTTDVAGNATTSAVRTVGVDNAPPSSSVTVVPGTRPDLQYWDVASRTYYYNPAGAGTLAVSDAAADTGGSGVAHVDFPALSTTGFTGAAASVASSPYESSTYSFTSANTTAPSLTVTVVDGAGNQTTESPTFVRDTTAPTGMSATVTGGWVTAASVPVTLDPGSDAGAGIDPASGIVERDETTLAGGSCGSFTGSWTPVTLSGGADTSVQSGHCYRYRSSVADRVGNRGTQAGASATVEVDTDAPSAPGLAYSGFTNASASGDTVYYRPGASGGFTVTPSATDPESGIASYGYPDLGAGWTRSGGDYAFDAGATDPAEPNDVTAVNGAGLASPPSSFTVTPDGAAPATTISCDGGACAGWHTTSPVSVALDATDAGSGVAQIRYTTDGSDPTSGGTVYTGPFDVAATTTVKFAARDAVGNVEAVGSQLVQVDSTPPSAPSLAYSGFTNASASGDTVYYRPGASGGFTVTPSATDPESGIASYGYPDLGAGWTRSGGDYSFDASATDPGEPNDVTAVNGAGLASPPSSFTVTPDGTAPATTISCDGASCTGWHTSSPVGVGLDATDGAGSGVTEIRYTTDGTDPTLLNGQPYLGAFDVSQTTTVKFRAWDAVGNAEPVATQVVQVDASAPSLSVAVASSTGDTSWNAGTGTLWYRPGGAGGFDLAATLSDAESGAAEVDFPALAGFGPASTDTAAPFEAAYSYSGSPAEPGTVTVHGQNGAGLDATASLDVKADGAAPSGGSISYAGGWSATGSVAISVDAGTDGESGLAPGGATIERSTAPLDEGACGTYGSWDPVTSPDALPDGVCARYRYRVADRVGNETAYTSPSVVRFDSTPPAGPALTLDESSPLEHASGTTLYYNPQGSNSGSFTVHAETDDAESGIARVDFPDVFGGDAQSVSSAPYDATYSWTAAASASGAHGVDAWNGAGASSSSSFTVTPDTAAPSGGSTDYPDGYAALPVTITTDPGSDGGSGLDAAAAALEGRTAPLGGSGCGAWGGWHAVTSPDTPAEGTCTQYRYRVSDNVGNETVYTSPNVVRADATPPTVSLDDPGASLRSTVSLTASADDAGAGVESVRFEQAPHGSGSWTTIDTDSSAPYSAAWDTTSLTDGLYDLRAVARDAAGNVTTSDPVTDRRVDNTPPAVSLDDPGSIVSGTVALSATADDLGGSGIASVRYEISPAGMADWHTVSASWDTSGSGDGLYDVRAVATDVAGNTSVSEVRTNVRVDDTPPTVTLHDPGANVAGVVSLGADVDDGDGSGVASVTYEYSHAGANSWTTTTTPAWDTTALADGLYDLRARATDRAGNETISALVIGVRVDNHPPTVSITSPADGSYVNAASPDPRTVVAAPADAGSGIDHVDFFACTDESTACATGTWDALGTATSAPWQADWPLPADGDRALEAVAVDRTGHTASAVVTVTVDRTPPDTTLDGTPGDPSNVATPDVSFSANEPGSTFECRLDGAAWQPCASPDTLAPLADGSHTVDVRATDPAGNVDASPATWTWLVDTTPPTATMDDPGRVVHGTVSLSSTTADPGEEASGIASVAYEYSADGGTTWAPAAADWDTTSVEDGVYELRVVATDHAGNVGASAPVGDVRVDNTAPTTSLDDPPANVRAQITLTGAAADAGSGVAQVQFQVSPAGASTWLPIGFATAAPYSVELDTTTLTDGLYDLRTVALDVAGNEGDGAPVTGIRVDNTAPTVSLASPGANLRRTVDLSGSADDGAGSGVASLVYEYSPAGAGDWHPAASTWNTSSVADGVYDLRAVATDAAGNVGTSPVVTSRVDNTPPSTTDNAPSGWQSSPVTVTLSASDAGSGPSATEYSVDGGPFQSGSSVDVPAPSDGSNDGSHTIAYFSTDVAGNVEAVHSTDVLIDASPPGSHPTDPGAYLRGTVTLHASPSAPSGIASVAFQYSPAGEDDWTTIATDTTAPYSAAWDTTAVDDGAYDLRFVVTDRSTPANVTRTTLPSKIVDNTPPGGVIGSPAAGETVTGDVTVSAAAHDATSLVASVELRVNGSTIATDTSAPYRATWDSTSAGDGSASVDAVITDLAGNTYTTPSVAFTVDNHAPTPTLDPVASPASGTITLSASSDSDTTDVEFQRSPAGANDWTTIGSDASSPFGASFVTTSVPDGSYDLRALATDGSGHRGASATRSILVDNTAPSATLTAPADGASVGGPSVALQASAGDGGGSGVASVAFEVRPTSGGAWTTITTDGSAPYTAAWDTTSLASGGYELRAVATDAAGNVSSAHPVTVTVDSTAPSVSLADPGSPLSGTVTLSATAGPSATRVAFEVSRAGAASWRTIASDTSAPWSASFDTRTVGDGLYDLRAVASDAFGNTRASVRAGIRIDNEAPSLVSSTPGEGATVASAGSIELVASEALARVSGVTLNGSGTVPPVVDGSHVSFATGALADGAYTLAGVLHDLAGKTGHFELHFTVSSGSPADPPPVSESTSSDDSTTVDASDGSASVTMPATAWADPGDGDWVVLTIDPRPATETLLPGYENDSEVESITARWALSGAEVHRFDAPLEILLRGARPDDVPVTSEGHGWRLVPALAGTTLPSGADDGFYRVGDTVHVLTRHLSLWALVRDTQAPAPPSDFHGVVAGGRLTLYWTPSADGGAPGGEVVLYVDGVQTARYPVSQTQADLGPFGFDDLRGFSLAQVDMAGNVGKRTVALRGLPELAGTTQDEAAAALAGRGFEVGSVTSEPSPQPAGTVLEPAAAAVAPEASPVDLVVSAGPGAGSVRPFRLRVVQAKRYAWRTQHAVGARVLVSRASAVNAVLKGAGGKPIRRWTFSVKAGSTAIRLAMPRSLRRPGVYRVLWTARAADGTTRAERHNLRIVAAPARRRRG